MVPRPLLVAGISLAVALSTASAAVITFDDLPLGSTGYWNGSDSSGGFTSGGATFVNSYNTSWGSWSGFAYSRLGDTTTAGWTNQYSAYTGSGLGGSGNFSLAYGGATIRLDAPTNLKGLGAWFTNTTYAALSMLNGDSFAKKFGGADGTDPDFFRLNIRGHNGEATTATIPFYLADFRYEDSAQDYLVTDWTFVDLSALGEVDRITFTFESSDVGDYGINTPVYFAMDHFLAVPEPSTLLASLAGLALLVRRRR